MLLKLAQAYAEAQGKTILDHKIYGDEIVFILSTGQKYRMDEEKLIAETASAQSAGGVPPASHEREVPPPAPTKKKGKVK